MTSVFKDTTGVACSVCNAVRAPRGKHGVCGACWGDYAYFYFTIQGKRAVFYKTEEAEFDENIFNAWLARRLVKSVKRMNKYGTLQRCEAISNFGSGRSGAGFQCGLPAIMLRNGRHVCHAHGERTCEENLRFVDSDRARDWYELMSEQVALLASKDARFAEAMQAGLNSVQHKEDSPT